MLLLDHAIVTTAVNFTNFTQYSIGLFKNGATIAI